MSVDSEKPIHVLLIVYSDSGRLNPFIGVAQELERAGARVTFVSCQDDVGPRIRRAGLLASCRVLQKKVAETSAAPAPSGALFAKRMKQVPWLRRWLSAVVIDQAPEQVEAITAIIEGLNPDVIGVDAMAYAGAIAASVSKVPWASIATALNPLVPAAFTSPWVEVFGQLSDARRKLFERYGLPSAFTVSDVTSPWLNTVFTVEEFVPRAASRNDFSFYVGPSLPTGERGDERDFDFDWLRRDRPLVYVSFGSLISPEIEVLQEILVGLGSEDLQIVVVAKDVIGDPFFQSLPSNVRAVAYAPQLKILERASVMITHGGHNSIKECLSLDVPMLVIPFLYDQPMNAEFVRASGAGHSLRLEEVSAARCRDLIVAMARGDSTERERARQIGAACRQSRGGKRTTELLLQLATAREPLRPPA